MVAQIELNRTLALKQNEQRIAEIGNQMETARVKADADAELYRAQKEAEANKLRLTPELLQLETVRALANNTKIYFGERIPSMFVDNQLLAGTAAAAGPAKR
jgi:erlin